MKSLTLEAKYKRKFQFLMLASLILFILDVSLHRPKDVNKLLNESFRLRNKKFKIQLPEIVKLETYLGVISNKEIFLREGLGETEKSQSQAELSGYEFNGIIQLEKPYVAIFKKSTKEQFLIPEGGKFEGIVVKKINPNSIIIEYYGEKKVISF